jgi:hypothetical protein
MLSNSTLAALGKSLNVRPLFASFAQQLECWLRLGRRSFASSAIDLFCWMFACLIGSLLLSN